MEQILGQILGEVKGIKAEVTGIKGKLDSLENKVDALQSGQKETYQLAKALESRTDTMSATLGNLEIQMAHLSGDVKEIKSATGKDQLYVLGRIGKCEKDIFELKQGAGQ